MTKSSPAFNIPNKTLKTDKGSKLITHSINQERSATQKDLVISELQNRCSRNSISFLQKVHCGESIILILKNFSFVKTMLFKTLYWNSLIFVSSDTLRESEYISFQSNWTSGNWSWNLACVQTSPLPQKKSGEETSSLPIFFLREGGRLNTGYWNLFWADGGVCFAILNAL